MSFIKFCCQKAKWGTVKIQQSVAFNTNVSGSHYVFLFCMLEVITYTSHANVGYCMLLDFIYIQMTFRSTCYVVSVKTFINPHFTSPHRPRSPYQFTCMKYTLHRDLVMDWTSWQKDSSDDWHRNMAANGSPCLLVTDKSLILQMVFASPFRFCCTHKHAAFTLLPCRFTVLTSGCGRPLPSDSIMTKVIQGWSVSMNWCALPLI